MARRMLMIARMKRVLLAAFLLAATAGTASAGGFVGLGLGTTPGISNDDDATADGRSARLEVGYSFTNFSIEGLASRFDLLDKFGTRYSDTSLGIAGTYRVPLSDGFGAYGRLGYQHTGVSLKTAEGAGASGSGILFGGGADFKLPLPATNLSIFVDYTIAHSSLRVDGEVDDEGHGLTSRTWTLGAKLGF